MFIGKNDINGLVKKFKQTGYTGKKGAERPVCSKTEKCQLYVGRQRF